MNFLTLVIDIHKWERHIEYAAVNNPFGTGELYSLFCRPIHSWFSTVVSKVEFCELELYIYRMIKRRVVCSNKHH